MGIMEEEDENSETVDTIFSELPYENHTHPPTELSSIEKLRYNKQFNTQIIDEVMRAHEIWYVLSHLRVSKRFLNLANEILAFPTIKYKPL